MDYRNLIGDQDLIYTYKEQWFTGFAPCFDEGLYSLACCKGKKNGGSLRDSACSKSKDKTVWILSIAGNNITTNGHNKSNIGYTYKDMICLARVTDTYSWPEYSEQFPSRRDSIYYVKDGSLTWRKNNDHPDGLFMETDCEIETMDFMTRKQIIVSNEYYIFKPGCKTCYEINRGFAYKNNDPMKLQKCLNNNEEYIEYKSENIYFNREA